jgi:hypothetical protein
MHKLFKQSTILFIAMALVTTTFGSVAMAQSQYRDHERTGEKMAVDAVLLRPAGLLATALGSLVFLVSVPFSALGGNTKEAYEEMVKKPARYTFKRQLGDF